MEAARIAVEIDPRNAPSGRLLQRSASAGPLTAVQLAAVTSKYWGKKGIILTVKFLDPATMQLRERILSHMNAWSEFCNVKFFLTCDDPDVRITMTPGEGYWSYTGTDIRMIPKDQPTMNLASFTMNTPDSEFRRVVRHETGHTLGFPHEHQRPEIVYRIDGNKARDYYYDNYKWDIDLVYKNIMKPLNNSDITKSSGPDTTSIMCYDLPAEIMRDGEGITGGTDIDERDRQFAAEIYPKPGFLLKYWQGDPGNGIGGYDLADPADRVIAYDFFHHRSSNYLLLYRPGAGTVSILCNFSGNFVKVANDDGPRTGFGFYHLDSPLDRVFAFDYDHSGMTDHLVLYRKGMGKISILRHGEAFRPVLEVDTGGQGIGGFDLSSPDDRAFAFDYEHSGKIDHLVFYRPGAGVIFILRNDQGAFRSVYRQGESGDGIGGYDLDDPNDRAFAFDYDHSGKQDHLVLYRPGSGMIWILKNDQGVFRPVFQVGETGVGIGGYDLTSGDDRGFALDYDQSGKMDHLVFYRPGTGKIWILKNDQGVFRPVYREDQLGFRIDGNQTTTPSVYDLASRADRAFAYSYDFNGKMDHIVFYRPGTGTIWIVGRKF